MFLKRIWSMLLTFGIVVVSTVGVGAGLSSTVLACGESAGGGKDGDTVTDVAASDPCPSPDNPNSPPPAPKKSTYCVGLEPPKVEIPLAPASAFKEQGKSLGLYKYADGREDSVFIEKPYIIHIQLGPINLRIPLLFPPRTVLVKDGGTPTHEKYRIWCQTTVPKLTGGSAIVKEKLNDVWVPLITPSAAAEGVNLYAKVMARLSTPQVVFVDADADHNWLWVQVEHRVAIVPPAPITESKTVTDPSGWSTASSVTAWLSATPVSLSIKVQSDAGEQYLGSCDLATATNGGCRALFRHASSISDDGRFHGIATIEWKLSSNAGILDAIGPVYTNSEFSVEVAEAMAVTNE